MAANSIQIRVDEELKKEAEVVFGRMGLDLSSAIRAFLKRAVLEGDFPFDIRQQDEQTRRTMRTVAVEERELTEVCDDLGVNWIEQ